MAQIQHDNVTQQLHELGLSTHEAEIYIAVLKKGEASAGTILDEVKLHREQVYRALKRLVDSGLLTHYIKRKRGYYAAVDPQALVSRIRAKIDIAESLQPYLRALHQQKPQIIRVSEGVEAYKAMFEDILSTLDKDNEYLVMSGAGKGFYELTKDFYPSYAKQFNKRNIRVRMTAYEGEDFTEQFASQQPLQIRIIPGSYAIPVATVVYGNKVVIEILDLENLAIITIENEKIADGYRHTFETLWQIGKEVTQ
jgi:sugar-specific transcriptional regulator TrmB